MSAEKVLIIVDMQKDFVDGALGTKEAAAILPGVEEKARTFPGRLIFTLDTHTADYLETSEGKNLPVVHCVKDTPGWRLAGQLEEIAREKNAEVIEKPTFGSVALAERLREEYEAGKLSSIELLGLCTDICVVSNALLLKAFMPELPITVDAALCAGVTPEKHEAALETMQSCQIMVTGA